MQFGSSEDKPALGDYDGDGKADIAVYRPSQGDWYWTNSSDGSFHGEQFGIETDVISPADYDGNGKTDLAVFRPSNGYWYIRYTGRGTVTATQFGITEDIPAAADFDGDGKADISVFRPSDGTWYRIKQLRRVVFCLSVRNHRRYSDAGGPKILSNCSTLIPAAH